GQAISVDSVSFGPDVKTQQVVTLHYTASADKLGQYGVRLLLKARSTLESTWDTMCKLAVSNTPLPTAPTLHAPYIVRYPPTKTTTQAPTPTVVYVFVTAPPPPPAIPADRPRPGGTASATATPLLVARSGGNSPAQPGAPGSRGPFPQDDTLRLGVSPQ